MDIVDMTLKGETISLKLRFKHGQSVIEGLTKESTIEVFQQMVCEISNIAPTSQAFRHGFPPKPFKLPQQGHITLGTLPYFNSGEVIIVEEGVSQVSKSTVETETGNIKRITVPADNSCLFQSIAYVVQGCKPSEDTSKKLRDTVASIIASTPTRYTEAILGQSNEDYCKWIQNPESWGGAIEVTILSEFYRMEVAVVDAQSVRINHFGENMDYKHRVIILYDGIHYDPLVLDVDGKQETVFQTDNEGVLQKALVLAGALHARRQFTDVNGFTLRCLVCQEGLAGQVQAQHHAIATGHHNYGEI